MPSDGLLPDSKDLLLAEIRDELQEMRKIMEQFQKFVLEVNPDAAISAVAGLEK